MSGRLASQVWQLKYDKTRAIILMALCDSAEDDGTRCYPSAAYTSWKTGSSVATVYRTLQDFEDTGVLVCVGMQGDTPHYHIHLEAAPLKTPWQARKRGRPRGAKNRVTTRKDSHGEKDLPQKIVSPREKSSHGEKTIVTTRKVFSPRESEAAILEPQTQAPSGSKGIDGGAESLLENHSYRVSLSESEASPLATIPAAWMDSDVLYAEVLDLMTERHYASSGQRHSWLEGAQLYRATDPARYVLAVRSGTQAMQIKNRYADMLARLIGEKRGIGPVPLTVEVRR